MLTLGEFVEWALVKRFGESEEIEKKVHVFDSNKAAYIWSVPNQTFKVKFFSGFGNKMSPKMSVSSRDFGLNTGLSTKELNELLDVFDWEELFMLFIRL